MVSNMDFWSAVTPSISYTPSSNSYVKIYSSEFIDIPGALSDIY